MFSQFVITDSWKGQFTKYHIPSRFASLSWEAFKWVLWAGICEEGFDSKDFGFQISGYVDLGSLSFSSPYIYITVISQKA